MKSFGHKRPVRDEDGNIIGTKDSPVRARSLDELGGNFGADKGRRVVVSLEAKDQIVLRLERSNKRKFQISVEHLWQHLLQCQANKA